MDVLATDGPPAPPEPAQRDRAGLVLLAALVLAIAILDQAAVIPITYDEAFNFNEYSSQGARRSFESYTYPNNHIFFTLVQTVLPNRAVRFWPPLLRLPNCAIVAALAAVLARLCRIAGWRRNGFVACGLLFCAPLFTLYLFVARGYLLGAVLALAATLFAVRRRPWLAGGAVGLAAATVPTYAFAAPAIAAIAWFCARRFRDAVAVFIPSAAIAALVYAPKLQAVAAQRKVWTTWTFREFAAAVAAAAGNAPALSLACFCLLIAAAIAAIRHGRETRVPFALLAVLASFFLSIFVLVGAGAIGAPFARNAMFVPLLAWLAAMLLCAVAPRWLRRTGAALLAVNACVGVWLAFSGFRPGRDPNGYPNMATLHPWPGHAALKLARKERFDALQANEWVFPAAVLYATATGLPLQVVKIAEDRCGVGSLLPPAHERAALLRGGSRLLLCY